MSYEQPNYTQIPNVLLDDHLPLMGEAELKVTLAIARKTFGWHKTGDQLSLSQLMALTGLSRHSVIDGISDGITRGTIHREESGQSFIYSLLVQNSTQNQREICTTTSANFAPELVQNLHTQKKGNKDKEITTSSRAQKSAAPTSPDTQSIIAAYIEVRGKNGINYGKEGTFAKKIVKDGYNAEQVKGCYLWMKNEPWWLDKPVTLDVIFKHLPEYTAWVERTITPLKAKEDTVVDIDWSAI